jgi:hypothetical protein
VSDTLASYRCEGEHHVVRWSRYLDDPGPVLVVARSSMPGKRWMRALRKIGKREEWHITAYRTKRDALQGFRL